MDVGKEGPMVHIGACFASLFGQGGSKQYRLTWRWITYLKNDRDRRDLVTCGAAAGVAAGVAGLGAGAGGKGVIGTCKRHRLCHNNHKLKYCNLCNIL